MAPEFSSLVSYLQRSCPELKGSGHAQWGARSANYREQIRSSIQTSLGRAQVSSPPNDPDWSISISHSKSFGGWLAVPRPWRVGFDAEQLFRIEPKLCARISSQAEMDMSPDCRFLWSAKEACFKSLEKNQPLTISEISIGNWQKFDTDVFAFIGNAEISGVIVANGYEVFAGALNVLI